MSFMEISKDKCTLILITVSLVVLVVDYELLTFDTFKFTFGMVTLSGSSTENNFLMSIVAFSIILASSMYHLRYRWIDVAQKYHEGYRESPDFVELIRKEINKAVGNDRYGSTYGGLKPTLWLGRFDLGRFTTDDDRLSKSVIVEPDARVHVKGCISGILRIMAIALWLPVYAPLIFGVWAASVIIV